MVLRVESIAGATADIYLAKKSSRQSINLTNSCV